MHHLWSLHDVTFRLERFILDCRIERDALCLMKEKNPTQKSGALGCRSGRGHLSRQSLQSGNVGCLGTLQDYRRSLDF